MNKHAHSFKNHVPQKLHKIHETVSEIERLYEHMNDLSESVFLDIIDGWSTGDRLLDFALISCTKAYDIDLFTEAYRYFSDLGLKNPGQKIMVIQKSEFFQNGKSYLLRNIHLAELRQDILETDVNSLSMHLPVKPGHIVWKEIFQDKGILVSAHKMSQDTWLLTGPIHNKWGAYSTSTKDGDGFISVPDNATCDILLIPETDRLVLMKDYGVHEHLFNQINQIWIRNLSTA